MIGLIMAFSLALNAEESKDVNSTDLDHWGDISEVTEALEKAKKAREREKKAIAENEAI